MDNTLTTYLQSHVKKHGSLRKAAAHVGVSPSHYSRVMRGLRSPSDDLLKRLNLQRQVVYVPCASSHS